VSADVDLRALIREIPDFPKPGIGFKDITPLLADPNGLDAAVTGLAKIAPPDIDVVIGAEARGFLLGPALARELDAGFVLARKPGKLPADTVRAEYVLEYGTDALELHTDAVASGARVLVHDDLLATGGTARTLCRLVEQLGGTVAGCGFLIELAFLNGRAALDGYGVCALLTYDEE
jgi:adenine phosphoribosyltransferase